MKKVIILCAAFAAITLFFLYGVTLYPHGARLPSGLSLEAPSAIHILGTDNLGVDIYSQVSSGFFRSMAIGLATAALAVCLGGFIGIMAGYLGGKFDALASFLINIFLSVPQLPIMIVVGAFFGQSTGNIIWIIAIFSWAQIAKQVRAKTLSVRGTRYVQLAKSYGGGAMYIIFKHMSRDIFPLLAINGIAVIGMAIIQESSLAYLGLSDPLAKSWGLMISKATAFPGIFFTDFWKWWILPPVFSLMLSVVCLRILAKALETYFIKER
jgi:peptide/nickel transport system permease protein